MQGYLEIRNIPKNTLKKINTAANFLKVSRQSVIDILIRNALLAMGASTDMKSDIMDSDEGYSNISIDSQIDQDDDLVTASSIGEEDVQMGDINSLQI